MEIFVFTDEMAYFCDACEKPWECTNSCQGIEGIAIAGGLK